MNNQPWECPRCKRINAPFTPSCFCSKDTESDKYKEAIERLRKPIFSFEEINKYAQNSRCSNCGGHHGMWNGKAIECVNLLSNV